MTKLKSIFLLSGMCLAGCAPLSQAALVYSSRIQVGLNLAAATPENPGLSINMGVNTTDVAYVPVVVGRPCEFAQGRDCNDQLTTIRGYNNVDSQHSDNGNSNDGPDGGDASPGPSQPAGGPKAMQDADQTAPVTAPEVVSAGVTAALVNKIRNSLDHTTDALSVYGTFDSNATAGGPGGATAGNANLRMGRSFSTGVASQHLTRGIRDATRADAHARCITAATTAVAGIQDAAVKQTRLLELLAVCAR